MKAITGEPDMAMGKEPTGANGDCGVDGVNSVGDPEPERTASLILVPWRLVASFSLLEPHGVDR